MAACISEESRDVPLPEGVSILPLLDGPVEVSRIAIRLTLEEDLPNVAFLANDVGVSAYLRDRFPSPYTMEDAKRFYGLQELQRADPENCMDHLFSVTIDNVVVGGCGLHLGRAEARHTAQMGYWLGRPYWKHGIAAIAVKLLLEYSWATFPGLIRIEAIVMAPNEASKRVLVKNGFYRESTMEYAYLKRGKLLDGETYVLIRDTIDPALLS